MWQHPIYLLVHYTFTAKEVRFFFTRKITNATENGYSLIGQAVTEVLCKSNYCNFHLQMGYSPITIAEHSKQNLIGISS